MIYLMKDKKWCAEKDKYINPEECTDATEDCECWCYHTRMMIRRLDKKEVATITYDRSLPEEDEPTTYITIIGEELDKLPGLMREALQKNPNDNFYIKVTVCI